MHGFKALIACVALALGGPTTAIAGDLNGTVVNTVDSITDTKPTADGSATTPNLAYFTVTLENTKPNSMSGVRFIANSIVLFKTTGLVVPNKAATYVGTSPTNQTVVSCSLVPADPPDSKISCALNGPLVNGAPVTFTVVFQVPKVETTTAEPDLQYLLRLGWSAVFDQSGNGGADGDAGGADNDGIIVSAATEDKIELFVPDAGTQITTVSANKWTTAVKVPLAGKKLGVTESVGHIPGTTICQNIQNGLRDCRVSNVEFTEPTGSGIVKLDSCDNNTVPCLVITLRRDASTIKGGRIENLFVYYEADDQPIPLCSSIPGGLPTRPGYLRCINDRYEITKKTPGSTSADWGDYIWVIWALENGRAFN